jgi:hypothetical protein
MKTYLAKNFSFSSKWKESEDVLRFIGCNMEISNIESPEAFRKIENFQLRFGFEKKMPV